MMNISLKLFNQYKIFFNFPPTSSHLYPLQVENCDGNSRLVVDEMTTVNSGLKTVTTYSLFIIQQKYDKFLCFVFRSG